MASSFPTPGFTTLPNSGSSWIWDIEKIGLYLPWFGELVTFGVLPKHLREQGCLGALWCSSSAENSLIYPKLNVLALSGAWEVTQGSATVAEHHAGRLDFLVTPRREPAGDRRPGIWGEFHFRWVHTRLDRTTPSPKTCWALSRHGSNLGNELNHVHGKGPSIMFT